MQGIFSYIPHLLFWGAQATSGILVMALSGPLVVALLKAAMAGQPPTNHDLLNSYPAVWQVVFEPSFARLAILGFIGLVVGTIFAECFYRLAIRVRYHEEFHLEADGNDGEEAAVSEFEVRCQLLKDSALHSVYEWENLQFSFIYYVEGNFWTLAVVMLVSGLIVCFSGGAVIDALSVIVLLIFLGAMLLALLMRNARIEKFKAFQNAYRVIKKLLQEQSNPAKASLNE